jgi:hypothetical protein
MKTQFGRPGRGEIILAGSVATLVAMCRASSRVSSWAVGLSPQ